MYVNSASPAETTTVFSPSTVKFKVKLVCVASSQVGESASPLKVAVGVTLLPSPSFAITKNVRFAVFWIIPSDRVVSML